MIYLSSKLKFLRSAICKLFFSITGNYSKGIVKLTGICTKYQFIYFQCIPIMTSSWLSDI